MKKLTSIVTVLLLTFILTVGAHAAEGDLFVQVNNDDGNPFDGGFECSILKVAPDGSLSEFITPAQIEAATGLDSNECANTGLAIQMGTGNVFFGVDQIVFQAFDPEMGIFETTNLSNILMATPDGTLSLFASSAQLLAAIPGATQVDLENGMTFGPDGALYVNDSESNSILRIPVPLGPITRVVTQEDIEPLLPPGATIDLDSGIAIDQFGNIYFANDDGFGGTGENNVIFKYSPTSGLSLLTTQQQIVNATGEIDLDLDVGMVLNGVLYVLVDDPCSCLLAVIPSNGQVQEFITGEQIADATGENFANPEGGLAADNRGDLFIGDFGGEEPGDQDEPNIVRVRNGKTSIFVSDSEIRNFYDAIDPEFDPGLEGSMAIEGFKAAVAQIPTLSEWGLIVMALVLGLVGFVAVRNRVVKA